MSHPTLHATDVRCLTENDQFVLIFLSGDDEVARVAIPARTAAAARDAIDQAIALGVKLAALGSLTPVDAPSAGVALGDDFPPLDFTEACVVVGAALRRVAPEDSVVGFELFALGNGLFDWQLEDAGPLGALYDAAVKQVLGKQAGSPRGIPMAPPIVDMGGAPSAI